MVYSVSMHDYSTFGAVWPAWVLAFFPLIIILALWTLVIKGYALWHAARGNQRGWFIALLIINTLGILEIIYLIWFRTSSSDTVTSASEKSGQ
jgi:hypothetical protein